MKTVTYLGKEYKVNDSAKFIVADWDGTVFSFVEKPVISKDGELNYLDSEYLGVVSHDFNVKECEGNLMKIVTYLEQDFEVPSWANFIAADPDGTVDVYETMPTWNYDFLCWFWVNGDTECVGQFDKQMQYMPPILAI